MHCIENDHKVLIDIDKYTFLISVISCQNNRSLIVCLVVKTIGHL